MLDAHIGDIPRRADVEQLRKLVGRQIGPVFKAKSVLLNPTFKGLSGISADADLVLDDTLIDVKTTKKLRIDTQDWRQLIGYAALNVHFPLGDKRRPLRRAGFYFSRHAFLATWPLTELVDAAKFAAFARWLQAHEKKLHAEQLTHEEPGLKK